MHVAPVLHQSKKARVLSFISNATEDPALGQPTTSSVKMQGGGRKKARVAGRGPSTPPAGKRSKTLLECWESKRSGAELADITDLTGSSPEHGPMASLATCAIAAGPEAELNDMEVNGIRDAMDIGKMVSAPSSRRCFLMLQTGGFQNRVAMMDKTYWPILKKCLYHFTLYHIHLCVSPCAGNPLQATEGEGNEGTGAELGGNRITSGNAYMLVYRRNNWPGHMFSSNSMPSTQLPDRLAPSLAPEATACCKRVLMVS